MYCEKKSKNKKVIKMNKVQNIFLEIECNDKLRNKKSYRK